MFNGLKRGIITLQANNPYLSNLISEERDIATGIKSISTANIAAASYLQLWGEGEHEDLQDITKQNAIMCAEFNVMLAEWEHSQLEFREKLKTIRTETDQIANTKKKVIEANAKLQKAKKGGKPTHDLEFQSQTLHKQLDNQSSDFEVRKRMHLQNGMIARSAGMMNFALKFKQFATSAQHLAHLIPQPDIKGGQNLPPYQDKNTAEEIVRDFQNAVYLVKVPTYEPPRHCEQPKFDEFSIKTKLEIISEQNSWANFPQPAAQSFNVLKPERMTEEKSKPSDEIIFQVKTITIDHPLASSEIVEKIPEPDSLKKIESSTTVSNPNQNPW